MKYHSIAMGLVSVAIYVGGAGCVGKAAAPPISLDNKDARSVSLSAQQVRASGTYADPKSWSEQTTPGAIHKGSSGYFQSRFSGSAATANRFFPPAGQDNNNWFWRGENAGLYSNPKFWSEITYVGAIHKGDSGYFESKFTGSAVTGNKYFPPAGQDNNNWFWRGTNAGLYTNPKLWSESSYRGAIHKGDSGYFESRFNGSAATGNKYFPPAGQDNNHWFWRGEHAGTFRDPKSWREVTYIGAIHGAGNSKRLESKFNGVAGPTDYYPTNNQDNTWWKVKAINCPLNVQALEPFNISQYAKEQRFGPDAHIDMAALVTKSNTNTSPLLQGLVSGHFSSWLQEGSSEVSSAILKNEKNVDVGFISVLLKKDGSFYALLESPAFRGTIHGNAQGEQVLMSEKPYDFLTPDTVELKDSEPANEATASTETDVDCNGTYVVDVMAAFSPDAVSQIGNESLAQDFARLEVESANFGLRNSRVSNVRLRFIGMAIAAGNFPMNTDSLGKLSKLFEQEILRSGGDVIAAFARGSDGDVLGWGYAPGRYSIQTINLPTLFRHEVAHNVGGNHCGTVTDYKKGYSNGTSSTILCHNSSPHYSTPLLSDWAGRPLGDAQTADMARLWREQATIMSSYQKAVVPVSGVIP